MMIKILRYWCVCGMTARANLLLGILTCPFVTLVLPRIFFKDIDKALANKGVPWSNVVGFESDTTNAMMGKHNSVLSRVKLKQPNVFSIGCVCHLANLCLLAGVQELPVDTTFLLIFITISTRVLNVKNCCMNSKCLLTLRN